MPTEDINMNAEDAAFLDIGDLVDVQDRAFGPVYPIVQWTNGSVQNKKSGGVDYTGGFFVSAEQGVQIPGAVPHTLITQNGSEVQGFAIRDLKGTPIRFRRSWLATPEEGALAIRFPWTGYEDAQEVDFRRAPRGRGQLLFLVEGMEEPVVLSFSGTVSGAVFSQGSKRGLLPSYAQLIVNQAKRIAKRKGRNIDYPLCAFRMAIGPDREESGEPKFTTVGSGSATSRVTMPVWLDRPTGMVEEPQIASVFVGRDQFSKNQSYHKDADAWVSAWSADVLIQQIKTSADSKRKLSEAAAQAGVEDGGAEQSALPGEKEVPF
jgi:hypothetical protein